EFLRRLLPRLCFIECAPARVDLNVAAFGPSQLLQSLLECGQVSLKFRVALGMRHQHADAPHALALLRARGKRPRSRAGEKRDEVAPFHCPVPPVLLRNSTRRTAALRDFGRANDRCGSKAALVVGAGRLLMSALPPKPDIILGSLPLPTLGEMPPSR